MGVSIEQYIEAVDYERREPRVGRGESGKDDERRSIANEISRGNTSGEREAMC